MIVKRLSKSAKAARTVQPKRKSATKRAQATRAATSKLPKKAAVNAVRLTR